MLKLLAVSAMLVALYIFLSRVGHGTGPVVMTVAAGYVSSLVFFLMRDA